MLKNNFYKTDMKIELNLLSLKIRTPNFPKKINL